MRVVYWTEEFWPRIGGVEINGTQLLPFLRERGHELTVVVGSRDESLPGEGSFRDIPVRRFPMAQALAAGDLEQVVAVRRQLAELWHQLRPELVHLTFAGPSPFFVRRLARTHPAPLLLTIPSFQGEGNASTGALLHHAVHSADWIAAVSRATREHLRELVPEVAARSSVIYNGHAPPPLGPSPLPEDRPALVCAGRHVHKKGFDLALAAFAAVAAERPAARLIVAGDGPERGTLERLAGELGIAEATEFLGWVSPDRLWDHFNRATVVVVPSRCREGFGLVALQAALMERPVVASRVGGLPEVVADGETGLLVASEDSDGLARAISGLLDDRDRAAGMGRAAARRARDLFSLDRQVDAYDDLYRRLVSRPAAACT